MCFIHSPSVSISCNNMLARKFCSTHCLVLRPYPCTNFVQRNVEVDGNRAGAHTELSRLSPSHNLVKAHVRCGQMCLL